jgi:PPK2 family polyphosphate:nucleotide phosphotransferase
MDGSGKDGITRAIFQGCSPAGVQVCSFKKPTEEEMGHDFLWRVHKQVPERGYIKVFNRSHYEDILIQYVRGWIDDDRREKRMSSINAFEELLTNDNRTTVLKYYLHISPEAQLEKLQERIDNPKKHWKHNDGDWEERKMWKQYRTAYEYAINNSAIGWHIIPCDKEWYRDYIAAKILCDALESLHMQLPLLNTVIFNKK